MDVKKIIVLFFLVSLSGKITAQNIAEKRAWYLPDFVVMQYAGSIGFLSAGGGYDIFKGKATVELLAGYVPRFTGSSTITAITLRFTAIPIRPVRISDALQLYPLTTGAYFSYTPGSEYSSDLPSWYPDGYYWWSEAVRVNIFIGSSIKLKLKNRQAQQHASAYYEIGTNEIKMVSYIQNAGTLNIWNVLHAGIGVRYHF